MEDSLKHLAKSRLQAALGFDIGHAITRYSKENGLPALYAERVACELKHYLVLCSLSKEKTYAVRDPVDRMWHTLIIFTKDYFKFCEVLDRRYLHHAPTEDIERKLSKKERYDSYVEMLQTYKEVFGYPPPDDIWQSPGLVPMTGSECDGGCQSDCGSDCSYYPPCCNK